MSKEQVQLISVKDIAFALGSRFSVRSIQNNSEDWGLVEKDKTKIVFNPRMILYDAAKVNKALIKSGVIAAPLKFE